MFLKIIPYYPGQLFGTRSNTVQPLGNPSPYPGFRTHGSGHTAIHCPTWVSKPTAISCPTWISEPMAMVTWQSVALLKFLNPWLATRQFVTTLSSSHSDPSLHLALLIVDFPQSGSTQITNFSQSVWIPPQVEAERMMLLFQEMAKVKIFSVLRLGVGGS